LSRALSPVRAACDHCGWRILSRQVVATSAQDEGEMEGGLALIGLVLVIAFFLGPIGFFLTLGLRSRLTAMEGLRERVATLEADLAASRTTTRRAQMAEAAAPTPPDFAPPAPAPAEAPAAPPPLPAEAAAPAAPPPIPPAAEAPSEPSRAAPAPLPPLPAAARTIDIEERLCAHWAVIVGGVALALGALLLVKYSIERGFFGPGPRVVAGLLVGIGLIAAGEYLRRGERSVLTAAGSVPIPSVLTGAGTVAAFGSLYAAHALYGFIGPGPALVLLGALGVAAMFAAALHGPALAGLGLVGALGAPLLVRSDAPNPWPVVLFIAVVCAAAYGLARLRRWLWLAIAAAAGAGAWQGLLLLAIKGRGHAFADASLAHVGVETALVLVAFAWAPHWMAPPPEQRTDQVASLAALGCAAVAAFVLAVVSFDGAYDAAWPLAAGFVAAALALTGALVPAAAAASAGAGVVILAALTTWSAGAFPIPDLRSYFSQWPPPQNETAFLGFGLVAAPALSALCVRRLLAAKQSSFLNAAIYAGVGVLTPLGALAIAYLRLANFEANTTFAAAGACLALAMTLVAPIFQRRREADASPAIELGLGAAASGAFAALALALVFALSQGSLTVALALSALAAAFVSEQLAIPALRWATMGLSLAVAGRLAYDPRVVGDDLGRTLVFNWLLFGYGAPALAFGLAARLMRSSGDDAPLRVTQALAILASALLLVFEIRHAMNGGDPFAAGSSLVEQGLLSVVGILFSVVLMEIGARNGGDWLYRNAALAVSALAMAQTFAGLLLWRNPYFSNEEIEGGAVFNALILGYALPALAAFALRRRARRRPPQWRWQAAAAAAIVLIFTYANLELRRLFQGSPQIGAFAATSQGEFYAYSALWLGLGVVLLAYGLLARSKPARLASAALVAATIVKVFLFDLAGLEGVLRALSFLGLGAALIGIGLVYQKFVFARPREAAAGSAVPPAPM
jgi:uncharacterized membrane protein